MIIRAIAVFVAALILTMQPAFANGVPADAVDVGFADQVIHTTINQMPPLESDGSVPYLAEEDASEVGYQPGREWTQGSRPADVLEVGDLEAGLAAQRLTLGQIAELTDLDLNELRLSELTFLKDLTLEQFIGDIPFLGEWAIENLGEAVPKIFGDAETINEALETMPELGDLGVLEVFGDAVVTDIPNLELAQLADFEEVADKAVSSIPGLGDVELGSFPNPLEMLNFFAKQDIAFGKEEYSGEEPTPQPVSGGTNGGKDWEAIPCVGGCPHIELTQTGWKGAQWMTKDHRVPDGYGLLGGMFGEAGAYRLPFGDSFALQVTGTDEASGMAEWGIAFRVCSNGLIDLGCTAYFLEVPLGIETAEKDMVLTGLRDGRGGASEPVKAPPGWEELRPATPPELGGILAQNSGGGSFTSLCGDGPGGIKLEAVAEALMTIESIGHNQYEAVGSFVQINSSETGRALGRYQYMSYKEIVVAKIGSTPAGAKLLAKARSGAEISGAEVLAAFPPDVQDAVFMENQTKNIEKAVAEGYTGDKLLEAIGQYHHGGEYATIDSSGVLREYGVKFRKLYTEFAAKTPDSKDRCKSTGNFINPTRKGSVYFTRGYKPGGTIHPVYGTMRPHHGDDIDIIQGDEIVASDSGVVEWIDQAGGWEGYGWYIDVHHGDGTKTRYAHLSKRLAPNGSKVEQGQTIALGGGDKGIQGSGTSTGSHLHFEVFIKGGRVDPRSVVDYNTKASDLK